MYHCRLRKLALVALLPLVGWLVLASAHDGPVSRGADPKKAEPDKGGPGNRHHDDAAPDKRASSDVQFLTPDGRELRVVLIHPQNKAAANYVPGLRFHRPLGALAERDKPIDGFPPIVDAVRREPDGTTLLKFRVIVSTPALRKMCRDAVLDKERAVLAQEKLTQDDIVIEPWPLKHCVITALDTFSNEVLGVSQTNTLTGVKDEFTFTMPFAPDELRKVLDLIHSGDLAFVYSYSYVGSTVYGGSVDLKAVKNAKLIASQTLRSEQREGKEPILQAEASEAVRHVYASVQKTMRASHKDLIPLLDAPNLLQKLFADDGQITFKDLKEGDEKTAAMLAAYLKPLLEQVRESFGKEQSEMTIHEDKAATTLGGGANTQVGVKIPLPIPISLSMGASLSGSKSKDVLDRIQHTTGSKWTYDKATERFRPHAIQKLRFQDGADQVLIDEKTTVFLAVGSENRYLEETPIPVTFTAKAAALKTSVAPGGALGPYEGVPLGAMISFFGSQLPKGYVWADGQASWPNADWVPVHLRGAKVPDMREHFVGGAKDEAKVGGIFDKGQVTVQPFKIAGSSFAVPMKPARLAGDGFIFRWENANSFEPGTPEPAKKLPAWVEVKVGGSGAFMRLAPVRAFFDTPQGLVSGEHSVKGLQSEPLNSAASNPRHVMCRWIIRVE
jgi:hypothetical protein